MICLPIDTFHDRFNASDNSPFGTHRHCGWRPIFCRKYTIYVRAIALRVSLSNCPQYPHERHCRPGHLVDVRFFLHITISIYAESRLNHNKQQKENCDHSARIVHRNKNAPISCRAQRTGTTHTESERREYRFAFRNCLRRAQDIIDNEMQLLSRRRPRRHTIWLDCNMRADDGWIVWRCGWWPPNAKHDSH